jgi:hypothetical protein
MTIPQDPPVLPGLNAIGYGYDVLGRYADVKSCMQPLFDFGPNDAAVSVNENQYSYPSQSKLAVLPINQSNNDTVVGESRSEYTKSLDVDTKLSGDYGFFEASMEIDFSSQSVETNDTSFITVRWVSELWRMSLPPVPDKSLLLPSFLADLEGPEQLDPAALFTRYGTHYVSSCTVGGRADYSSSIATSTFSSIKTLTIAAQMSYDSIRGSISASNKTTYQTQIDTFNENSESRSNTQGGDNALGRDVLNGQSAFDVWADTIPTMPDMVDFNQSSLVEIWTLCSSPDRAEQLQAAYDPFMQYRLTYQMTNNLLPAGTDEGSGAHMDVALFRPGGLSDGYFWVGQYAQSSYGQPGNDAQLLIIQPSRPSAVALPTSWVQVWNDHGSDRSNDYSMWKPVPPTDYVALGHLVRFNIGDYNPPSGDEIAGFRCVHKTLATQVADVGTLIWNDQGSRATQDGAIWQIVPTDTSEAFSAGTFYTTQGYGTPQNPLNDMHCLLRNRCDPAGS